MARTPDVVAMKRRSQRAQPPPVRSAHEALRLVDRRRVRLFSELMVGFSLCAAAGTELLGGDLALRRVAQGATLLWTAAGLWFLWRTRRARDDHPVHETLFGVVSAVAFVLTLPFFGPLGGIVLMVPLGILLLTGAESAVVAGLVYGMAAAGQAIVVVGVYVGWIPNAGLDRMPATAVGVFVPLFFQQLVFFMTFLLARGTRAFLWNGLLELERTTRELARREAELLEAYDALARASTAGGRTLSGAILGKWRLEELLGRGGAGEVYAARHIDDGRPAAVKVLGRGTINDSELVERFVREARLLRQIDSPHVVRLLDAPHMDEGFPFLAMERLRGITLSGLLRERGRLDPMDVVELAAQVAAGLGAAHAMGVIHRDLKPANVFRVAGSSADPPTWKVLDFGVSKMAGEDPTRPGVVLGTPAYASPEQIQGGTIDARCDVHGLALVVYRALTGRPPFAAGTPEATMRDVLRRLPPPPSVLVPGLSPAVDDVLFWGLAKRPRERPASTELFADALASAIRASGTPPLADGNRADVPAAAAGLGLTPASTSEDES